MTTFSRTPPSLLHHHSFPPSAHPLSSCSFIMTDDDVSNTSPEPACQCSTKAESALQFRTPPILYVCVLCVHRSFRRPLSPLPNLALPISRTSSNRHSLRSILLLCKATLPLTSYHTVRSNRMHHSVHSIRNFLRLKPLPQATLAYRSLSSSSCHHSSLPPSASSSPHPLLQDDLRFPLFAFGFLSAWSH